MRCFSISFLSIGLLISHLSFGQDQKPNLIANNFKKNYYEIGVGYNFRSGIGVQEEYAMSRDGSVVSKNKGVSYGKGLDFSMAYGRKFSRNFGLELNLGVMGGGASTITNTIDVDDPQDPFKLTQTVNYKATTFRVNPRLVLELPLSKTNFFYTKLGYMIGFGKSKTIIKEVADFERGTTSGGNFEWLNEGGFVSGSTTALGFKFEALEDTYFFIELTNNNLHRQFSKSTLTKSEIAGYNNLDYLSTYDKNIIYKDHASIPVSPDLTKAKEAPFYKANYSTVGFKLGFVVAF